jgi:pimeloyl-ACP methyl ester carboxylesterase
MATHRAVARWPRRTRWRLLPSPTAIQPVIIGDNHEALRIASALYERGLWVPAIRPPTVPKGKRTPARIADRGAQRSAVGPPGRRRCGSWHELPAAGPDLALIHGWGLGSAVWQPVLEPLSRRCRVHLVDLPGYGQSRRRDAHTISTKRTAQACSTPLPDPVTLCGWSLGAMLAMRAALLAPQRVPGWCWSAPPPVSCSARLAGSTNAGPARQLFGQRRRQPEQTLQRFVALLCQGDQQARSLTRTLLAGLRKRPCPASKRCAAAWTGCARSTCVPCCRHCDPQPADPRRQDR